MIWRTTSWCQIIFKWSKGDWNTSSMFRTFPKMFKCFQNRSKQTVVKSAKSLKLENTLVSLKTQIPAKTVVKTQCHRNSIQWNTVHSRTFSAHQKCRISMNTDVKCSRSIIQWTIVPNRGPQRSKPSVHREEARRSNTIYSQGWRGFLISHSATAEHPACSFGSFLLVRLQSRMLQSIASKVNYPIDTMSSHYRRSRCRHQTARPYARCVNWAAS